VYVTQLAILAVANAVANIESVLARQKVFSCADPSFSAKNVPYWQSGYSKIFVANKPNVYTVDGNLGLHEALDVFSDTNDITKNINIFLKNGIQTTFIYNK